MEKTNYQKIRSDLLSGLTERQREVILRRFGLESFKRRETLESIGKDFNVCRERVRQIQQASLQKIKLRAKNYSKIFESFTKYLKSFGGLRKEDVLLEVLGGEKWQNDIYFLLALKESFQRLNENDDFYPLWTINQDSCILAKKTINSLCARLKEEKKPLPLKDLNSFLPLKRKNLLSYLEVSKKINKNQEDLYGLSNWPEINPRGVKDRAYLAFKKTGKPLHFIEVANLIEGGHPQTVHNELIKDSRFVLVGRGMYALSEWGYYPGHVKDIISKVLQEAERPLAKEEILGKVLKQRLVKQNTVILNLSNKKYFIRDLDGRYRIREI